MLVFGFGITTDVDNLTFAVLDRDSTPESRAYLEEFARLALLHRAAADRRHAELERRLRNGESRLAIEIPPGFGRDIKQGRPTEVGVWIDGAMPFRAETISGYVQGVHQHFLADLAQRRNAPASRRQPANDRDPLPLQPGFRERLRDGARHHRASCWC